MMFYLNGKVQRLFLPIDFLSTLFFPIPADGENQRTFGAFRACLELQK
jgi:hypothetical protein